MQPLYFVADSFTKAKQQITEYCDDINKPFAVTYDGANDTVTVDRKIKTRMEGEASMGMSGPEGPLF